MKDDNRNETKKEDYFPCETCKADRKIVNVEKVSDTKKQLTLECGHSWGKIVMISNDSMTITEGKMIWTSDKDPEAEIRKAIEDNDYVKIVTLACSIFEDYGKKILIWHLKENPNMRVTIALDIKNNKNLLRLDYETALKKNKLKDLHVVIDALALCEIISDDDATKMHCVRQVRNNFLHRGSLFKLTSRIVEKVNARIEDIMNYTPKLKAVYGELAAKAEAGAAVAD